MQEIHSFADFTLDSNASRYQGYEVWAFSLFAQELSRTGFSSKLAIYNAQIIDMLSRPDAESKFYTRDASGKIIEGSELSLSLH